MQILIGIFIMIIGILLAYIYKMKREIKNISTQLKEYNEFKTEKKIDVSLMEKELEVLAKEINKSIDIAREMKIKEIHNKNELKNMISNISHDLRTPLTSIIGYIQILKKNNNNEKEEEYLKRIEKRAKDLQILLEDFFKLSVIEAEEYKMELEVVNISEILCDTLINYYNQFEECKIEPKIDVKMDYFIIGNKKEVKRIIENLLNNIIKHSEGDVKIILERKSGIFLSVINKVKGNIEEKKLFNKFYKGNDEGRRGKSTGLGLSITRGLIEKMGGSIEGKVREGKLYIICKWKESE